MFLGDLHETQRIAKLRKSGRIGTTSNPSVKITDSVKSEQGDEENVGNVGREIGGAARQSAEVADEVEQDLDDIEIDELEEDEVELTTRVPEEPSAMEDPPATPTSSVRAPFPILRTNHDLKFISLGWLT